MPAVVAVHEAVARIVLHPVGEEGEAGLALAQLVEQMAADMGAMRALRKGCECCINVALALVEMAELDLREGELGAIPPVIAIVLLERFQQGELVDLAADLAGESNQAEHAGRRREHHRVTRPGLAVLADCFERSLALAGQDLVEDGDMALLARRGAGDELERPCARRLGLVAAAQQLLGAGQRDVGESEALVGGDRVGKRGIRAGGGGHQAVDAPDIGVACRARGCAQLVAVAILHL